MRASRMTEAYHPLSAPVTLLFTDLVNSTELLQRVGDERAQRIFQAHHRLLKDIVAAHGGQEVKWLGDGLMTVFASAADAVRAAVAMQQAARRRAAGERLALRVGLHAGEALREETDYFGTPVVIARRLCEQAAGRTDSRERRRRRPAGRAAGVPVLRGRARSSSEASPHRSRRTRCRISRTSRRRC